MRVGHHLDRLQQLAGLLCCRSARGSFCEVFQLAERGENLLFVDAVGFHAGVEANLFLRAEADFQHLAVRDGAVAEGKKIHV